MTHLPLTPTCIDHRARTLLGAVPCTVSRQQGGTKICGRCTELLFHEHEGAQPCESGTACRPIGQRSCHRHVKGVHAGTVGVAQALLKDPTRKRRLRIQRDGNDCETPLWSMIKLRTRPARSRQPLGLSSRRLDAHDIGCLRQFFGKC